MAKTLGFEVVVTEEEPQFSKICKGSELMWCDDGSAMSWACQHCVSSWKCHFHTNSSFGRIGIASKNWLWKLIKGHEPKVHWIQDWWGRELSKTTYPPDQVFRNPDSISEHGWDAVKAVYLEKHNVKLDVGRFRPTLLQAIRLLHLYMCLYTELENTTVKSFLIESFYKYFVCKIHFSITFHVTATCNETWLDQKKKC